LFGNCHVLASRSFAEVTLAVILKLSYQIRILAMDRDAMAGCPLQHPRRPSNLVEPSPANTVVDRKGLVSTPGKENPLVAAQNLVPEFV
jgi:hypothetical protein